VAASTSAGEPKSSAKSGDVARPGALAVNFGQEPGVVDPHPDAGLGVDVRGTGLERRERNPSSS
jgi:hypothetical protein